MGGERVRDCEKRKEPAEEQQVQRRERTDDRRGDRHEPATARGARRRKASGSVISAAERRGDCVRPVAQSRAEGEPGLGLAEREQRERENCVCE